MKHPGRFAANHRWAYERQRDLFMEEMIFDPSRNEYFQKRYNKARKGLRNGYRFKKQNVQGKHNSLGSVLITNIHTGCLYIIRIWRKQGAKRGLASCTCQDFNRNKKFKVPCKHIWMVQMTDRMGDVIVGWK